MPIYEFVCTACAVRFDHMCSFDTAEKSPPACTDCGEPTTRAVTAAGGYKMTGDNSASRTPKGSGSFSRGRK